MTLAFLLLATIAAEGGEICRFRALDPENPSRRWLGSPLAPGIERSVEARGGGPSAVVGWLHVPEPERGAALPETTGVLAPAVRAGLRDADPLPAPSLPGAFFRIPEVAAGSAELRVEGREWLPSCRVVKVQPGLTVAAAPLSVRAAGTLTVHWNTDQDLPALDRSLGACQESEEPPRLVIAISKCAPRRAPDRAPIPTTARRSASRRWTASSGA